MVSPWPFRRAIGASRSVGGLPAGGEDRHEGALARLVMFHPGVHEPLPGAPFGVLDEEIERLERARDYLQGELLCRFDHPATDCVVMGEEIDRRLSATVF